MSDLLTEVNRFQQWAGEYPHAWRYGEWECDYEDWRALHNVVLRFVATSQPFEAWSEAEVLAVLYVIARDNETQYLASEVRRRRPELIVPLTRAALRVGEPDNRWQLAVELEHEPGPEAEPLLLNLARDDREYVRRRALKSLAKRGSPAVEELALQAWHRPDPDQEWARMMALWCLQGIGSPHLDRLLTDAERDEREHLRLYAERMRRGEAVD